MSVDGCTKKMSLTQRLHGIMSGYMLLGLYVADIVGI